MTEIRCAVELRRDDSRLSPGRLVGVLLRYGERAHDRAERFARGALHWPAEGVVLNRQHRRDSPIARVVPEVVGDEVRVDVPLPDTAAGRDAAAEVRAGLLPGLSVEFRALRSVYEGGVRVIREASLLAAGLVDSPSYAGSTAEVRADRQRPRRLYL